MSERSFTLSDAAFTAPLVGVDLGGTTAIAGLVTRGKVARETTVRVSSRAEERVVLEEIFRAIDGVFEDGVSGIGVGVPGIVDVASGVLFELVNIPSFREVPLRALLEQRYGVKAHLNNDANCFAIGEQAFGKARGLSNVIGITLGTGLGAGVIADGKLYNGTRCGAGELGHMAYLDKEYESYCSGKFFAEVHGIAGDKAFKLALQGDAVAIAMFEELGWHIGKVCCAALYAYDPQMIILGGSVSRAFSLFEKSMWRALDAFAFKKTLKEVRICASDEPKIALLGAAALCL